MFIGYFAERQDVRTNRYSLPAKTSIDIGTSSIVHNNLGKSSSKYDILFMFKICVYFINNVLNIYIYIIVRSPMIILFRVSGLY